MAKQSVALAANLRGMPNAFPTASAGWSTNGSISASSVARNTQTAEYWTNGASSSPAGMIDAVAAISSTALKNTQIDLSWTIRLTNQTGGPVFSYDMCVFIDWENPDGPKVTWSGRAFGGFSFIHSFTFYGIFSGKANIDPLGSTVSMAVNRRNLPASNSNGAVGVPPTMTLITGPNRNILGLPAPLTNAVRENAVPEAMGNYTITTDTGINVTAAPTPPAETPTVAPVVGVKISELNAVSSLQDDDLFVLSQDNLSDGTYDASKNVTLSTLKTSIAGSAGAFTPINAGSDVMSVLQSRNTGFSGTVSLTPPTGKKFAILSCQLDCDASGSGGNWLLVIGKNLDTDLPVGTYPAGTGKSYSPAQFDEIYKYSVSETSNTLTDPNGTNTNLRYVYVGDGGTVSMPWRILINTGPSGAVAVTITLVGWA